MYVNESGSQLYDFYKKYVSIFNTVICLMHPPSAFGPVCNRGSFKKIENDIISNYNILKSPTKKVWQISKKYHL